MNVCEAELCRHWTGDGCVCDVMGIERRRVCSLCWNDLGDTEFCPSCEQHREAS